VRKKKKKNLKNTLKRWEPTARWTGKKKGGCQCFPKKATGGRDRTKKGNARKEGGGKEVPLGGKAVKERQPEGVRGPTFEGVAANAIKKKKSQKKKATPNKKRLGTTSS